MTDNPVRGHASPVNYARYLAALQRIVRETGAGRIADLAPEQAEACKAEARREAEGAS